MIDTNSKLIDCKIVVKRKILTLLLLILPLCVFSQLRIDSLLKLIPANGSIEKTHLYNELANEYFNTNQLEKCYEYTQRALADAEKQDNKLELAVGYITLAGYSVRTNNPDMAMEHLLKAQRFANDIKANDILSRCYNSLGDLYFNWSNFEKSLEYFTKALDLSVLIADEKGTGKACYNLGKTNFRLSKFSESLESNQKALKIFEKIKYTKGISACLNAIGLIYGTWKEYDKAIESYNAGLDIAIETANDMEVGNIYNNIGTIYSQMQNFEQALIYYEKSLAKRQEMDFQQGIASSYHDLGNFFYDLKTYSKAQEYYGKALQLYISLNDTYGIIINLNAIGRNQRGKGNFTQAIAHCNEGLSLAKETAQKNLVMESLLELSVIYKLQRDFEKSLFYYTQYTDTKDSIFNSEKFQKLSELQTQYETEKKQQQIELQKSQIDKNHVELKQRQTQRNAFIAGFVLVLFLAIAILRGFVHKKKANVQLAKQKEEIESLFNLAVKRKELVEQQKEEIMDSIHYAKRIQGAVLPTNELLGKIFREYFILYKPREIVSGDFYWVTQIEDHVIVAVADCTGHGVPGAFMSMLGTAFLNEIVRKEYITHPGVILRKLRKEIIRSLQQKDEIASSAALIGVKDGMDIALCSIHNKTQELQYSGAHNSLYIVRKSEYPPIQSDYQVEEGDYRLYELKGDRMPVSIFARMDKFETREVSLMDGDEIILFSDGFADQFGGQSGKKFMYTPFKKFLCQNAHLSLSEQSTRLHACLTEWQNPSPEANKEIFDQIDDITVMGFRL